MSETAARSSVRRALGASFALALAAGCVNGRPGDSDYARQLEEARRAKDVALRSQPDPVAAALTNTLLPLLYFPPDPSYNVPAPLKRSADVKPLQMVYSDGVIRDVQRVGALEFTLKGQLRHLSAFVEVAARDLDSLFVPFVIYQSNRDVRAGRLLSLHHNLGLLRARLQLAYAALPQSALFLPGRTQGK